jgi:hypothetical protein
MAHGITTILYRATRVDNSANGNPTWTLHTSNGNYRTGRDSSFGYALDNYEHLLGEQVTLTLNVHGHVTHLNTVPA